MTSIPSNIEKQQLYVQYAVSRVLLEATNLKDAAQGILQAIGEGMPQEDLSISWEVGVFWLVDPHTRVLRCLTTWHAPTVEVSDFEQATLQMTFAWGQGLPGRVWATGEPTWISNVLTESNFPRQSLTNDLELHAAFAFPIRGASGILGIIEFFSSQIASSDPYLIRAVITIGNQVGQFLERKRAEEALRASDVRKGAMLQTALDAIVTIDSQGKIIEWNPAAEKMFGYSQEAALGQEMANLIIPPSLRAQHRQGLAHYLATGRGLFINRRIEVTAMRADGSELPVELAITRVPLDGSPLFTGYIRDITERKQVEQERTQLLVREQEARAEAEAATRRLQALLTVTDTALAHLALNDLLRELLSRIHQVMAVDNVAILLTTDDNQYLALRAAFGPEEEVAGQVRVPIGKGFAGTIVATAKPRIIEDLYAVEIMTPILREKLKSLLGVPLLVADPTGPSAASRVIGVIHIGTMSSRRFTEDDVQLLERVAERVALAIMQSRLYEAEQRARNEAIVRANEQERLERQTRNSLNSLLAMAEALVLVPDDANLTEHTGDAVSISSEPTAALARHLAELICNVLACKRVAITVLDPETKEPRAVAAVGISPEQEQKWRNRESGSVLAHMFTDPVYTARLQAGEILAVDMTQPPFRDYPNPYGIRNMLLAPMSLSNTLVGFLAVDDGGTEHSYTSKEITMTSAVTKLAALVIERARLLQERAEAHASVLALQQANQRMDTFLGIASHELRTPLTTLKANIQMAERQLKKHLGTEDILARLALIQELLERADQQSSVLNRLIGDLLNVSRIQTNTLEMHIRPAPCNLLTIVKQAVEDQRKVTPKRVILLQTTTQESVPVLADPDRIAQVIMNFLINALKYSSADQPIEVSLEIVGADVSSPSPMNQPFARLSVSDHGPGLTPSQQAHLWERFYRVPDIEVKSGSGVGLGLGLYISKTIIERHSGQVGVHSIPGKGSTFWFTLPLAQ